MDVIFIVKIILFFNVFVMGVGFMCVDFNLIYVINFLWLFYVWFYVVW